MARSRTCELFHGVAIFVFISAMVLCAPGLAMTSLVDQLLALHLDRGQLWAFGATASAMMMFVAVGLSGGRLVGVYRHFALSVGTVAVLLVAHHGCHLRAFGEMWRALWP